jgi:RNA-directed DNA polymerase
MNAAQTARLMSPGLMKVVERAKSNPTTQFTALAHLIDESALRRAYERIRKDAAVGVDGITKGAYGESLDENIRDLHRRLRSMRYRHQPILRVHIPKASGKTRPIGISCIEDKIVQGAITELLEVVYEPSFLPCSYGFRRGCSPHDALRMVNRMASREGIGWILEADIQAYFDSLLRPRLRKILRERVVDGSLLRLVAKCLHVRVLDGEEYSEPELGTAQGSVLSPLLGNVYLHHVLDQWFECEVKPQLAGHARLIRYCDDFVIGFVHREDAEQVLRMLHERMSDYGLTLHPEKTRLIRFRRPARNSNQRKGPGVFDFLGFTVYWQRARNGGWRLGMKTRKAKLHRAIKALNDWCRRYMHLPRKEQHAALSRRIRGHYNYFGINGNRRALSYLHHRVRRTWLRYLRRRSQRARRRLTWEGFNAYLKAFPLPQPRVYVQIWG